MATRKLSNGVVVTRRVKDIVATAGCASVQEDRASWRNDDDRRIEPDKDSGPGWKKWMEHDVVVATIGYDLCISDFIRTVIAVRNNRGHWMDLLELLECPSIGQKERDLLTSG